MNRALLEKSFEPNQIKQRQGNFGHILDYVEGHVVTSRLNDAFESNWSFEIVKYRIIKDPGEVLVLGKLTAEGVTKMAFGSKEIERSKDTKAIVSLGGDLKAAATDSLKKAASLLGVGLYLYSDQRPNGKPQEGHPEKPDKGSSTGNEKNQPGPKNESATGDGNGNRLTNKQLGAIFSIGKSRGLESSNIKDLALKTFKKSVNHLNKEQADTYIKTLLSMQGK
jgi:hypothetical protein